MHANDVHYEMEGVFKSQERVEIVLPRVMPIFTTYIRPWSPPAKKKRVNEYLVGFLIYKPKIIKQSMKTKMYVYVWAKENAHNGLANLIQSRSTRKL